MPHTDEGKAILSIEKKAYIHHAILLEGKSRREVARETGYSRNTIRKMLLDSTRPKYQMQVARPSPVLGPYKELLAHWVVEDSQKPKKQRRTAQRMYQRLRDEYGYQGAESTVRYNVGQLRRQATRRVDITLAYEPDETAQVDFGEAEVQIAARLYSLVDLFAGCGGLSLGFENAGFTPVFVNELNDDALRTYLLNREHALGGMKFAENRTLHCHDVHDLQGVRLAQLKADLTNISTLDLQLCNMSPSQFEGSNLDIVAGGPPCQGYSGIGHRRSYNVEKQDLPQNRLYVQMCHIIRALRPRILGVFA